MKILSIDTSCDETSVAITEGRRVLSNVIYSQMLMHKEWGGVVPSIAKRAHEERISSVIEEAFKKAKVTGDDLDYIAVTYGPGLAIALEVGIKHARELAQKYSKPLIAVNHMEGHIYASFVQNSKGNPDHGFHFPYLALLISGAHTELVIVKDHLTYEIIGKTRDDAAGEAIDKAARMLELGYPGGPPLERLAAEVENVDIYKFPRSMLQSHDLDFSFSGLKTSFMYFLKNMSDEDKHSHINNLASSFQDAVFDSMLRKTEKAIQQTGISNLIVGGGVSANQYLRKLLRKLAATYNGEVFFPTYKTLTGDNAAMIGVAAYYRAQKGLYVPATEKIDRVPRLSLKDTSI